MALLEYRTSFSCSAGAIILCARPVGLLEANTPISLLATFSLWISTVYKTNEEKMHIQLNCKRTELTIDEER